MKLSSAQDKLYWREWAAVWRKSKGQHADAGELRADLHRQALAACRKDGGRPCRACIILLVQPRISHTDIDRGHQFDEILKTFRAISRPADMDGQLSLQAQHRKRVLWRVRQQLDYLRAMGDDPVQYIQPILAQRFHVERIDQLNAQPMGPYRKSDLEQFLITLTARVNAHRRKAGLTLDEMKALAH